MSWPHFVIGLRRMGHEDGATLVREARAGRLAQAEGKDFERAVKAYDTILGVR